MLNDLPVLYAARHPKSGHWFVDESRDFVAGLAGHEGAEVVAVDVPGLLRVMRAAQQVCAADNEDGYESAAFDVGLFNLYTALAALTKEPTP